MGVVTPCKPSVTGWAPAKNIDVADKIMGHRNFIGPDQEDYKCLSKKEVVFSLAVCEASGSCCRLPA